MPLASSVFSPYSGNDSLCCCCCHSNGFFIVAKYTQRLWARMVCIAYFNDQIWPYVCRCIDDHKYMRTILNGWLMISWLFFVYSGILFVVDCANSPMPVSANIFINWCELCSMSSTTCQYMNTMYIECSYDWHSTLERTTIDILTIINAACVVAYVVLPYVIMFLSASYHKIQHPKQFHSQIFYCFHYSYYFSTE